MSGIAGIIHFDGAPASHLMLGGMIALMKRRAPEEKSIWHDGSVCIGLSRLPGKMTADTQCGPGRDSESGCVIAGDIRLDNGAELASALGLPRSPLEASGAAVVLRSYEAWGEGCVDRLRGDFAFAIWDCRRARLFCARDHFGLKPFYYHYSRGQVFVFASVARVICCVPQVPFKLNDERIADFLVDGLEGLGFESTFFRGIFRLPPAHSVLITRDGLTHRRYWSPPLCAELRLRSNAAYSEHLHDVLSSAVRSRLLGAPSPAVMLSGGIDSGAVAAVGSVIHQDLVGAPLATYSAAAASGADCAETQAIEKAIGSLDIAATLVRLDALSDYRSALDALTWELEEPFDYHMALQRVLYIAAHARGVRTMVDGGAADVVLAPGSHLVRLVKSGRWLTAWREARGIQAFYGRAVPVSRQVLTAVAASLSPKAVRQIGRSSRRRRRYEGQIQNSIVNPDLAEAVELLHRLDGLEAQWRAVGALSYSEERARAICHPFTTVGRERYGRVASALSIDAQDPFLDLRVVAACLQLPGDQRLGGGGWPKVALRRAMKGKLPDEVCWRRGKTHIGPAFSAAVRALQKNATLAELENGWQQLLPYVRIDRVRGACASYAEHGDSADAETVCSAAHLAAWLARNARRPHLP
jgi:asparagine synthase (glutamine-hydrolysing)